MELVLVKLLEAVIVVLNTTNWINGTLAERELYHFIGDNAQDAIYKLKGRMG